jgi:hypothetical protein
MSNIFDKQKKTIRVKEPGNNKIDIYELLVSIKKNLKLVFVKYKVLVVTTLQSSVRKLSFLWVVLPVSHFLTFGYSPCHCIDCW